MKAHLADLHTCLKLIPLALLRNLQWRSHGFGLAGEITARLLRLGIGPFEVPVSYYSRSHAEGKKQMAGRSGLFPHPGPGPLLPQAPCRS